MTALLYRRVQNVIFSLIAIGVAAPPLLGQRLPPADPPYVPTPLALVHAMLDIAAVGASDTVYDLGSGDGRIVIEAARRGARAVGVEYAGELVERSWSNADSAGVRAQVSFIHGDVFDADVSDASVVMMYLGADFNARLRPRLLAQLRPGSRVVSHAFHMGEWAPDRTRTIGSGASRATLYSWIVPARVDGFWSLEIDGLETTALEFMQDFQMLTGGARIEGQDLVLEDGRLRGETVRFELRGGASPQERFVFTGRLREGRLSGTVQGPSTWGSRRWRATRFTDPAPGSY